MGLFDNFKNDALNKLKNVVEREVNKAAYDAKHDAEDFLKDQAKYITGEARTEKFVFDYAPKNVEELQDLKNYSLNTPYKTCALVMLALLRYEESPKDFYAMFDELNGPNEVTEHDKQFLSDRFKNAPYIARSFFEGATPENNYTPKEPLTIKIYKQPDHKDEENYQTLWVQSAGADNLRCVILRRKPSVGKWYINEIQCLGDIRIPVELDEWA